MPRWILFGFMVSMHADTSTTLSTGTTTTRGTGSVSARLSAVGDANLLPFLQVQARYTGEETVGWPHLEPRASVIVPYNWSAICADPKRPRDVCSAPPLDLNDGNKVSRYLPYLNFNQFRTERTPTKIPTITLSDHKLKVDITPQFGGKVYAMTDVPTGRSLLHTPKIHQPIIAARLDAQVDGGIEWNWSPGKLGHWVGTEQDVYAAQLDTVKGPMVRVYEYDRWNQTVFQVDMIVQNGTLFAHPKVTNPHAHNITGYWWTCVGMKLTSNTSECHSSHETKGTRVLTPAAYNVNDALEAIPWPNVTNAGGNTDNRSHDMSFLSSWSTGGDNFVRILSPTRPHVTVIDKDIFGPTVGLYHGHPLNGTKFWVGSAGKGSKRWYNWKDAPPSPNLPSTGNNSGGLSEGGCFFEPQIGHGPTQATGFDFPGNTSIEWTEVFKTLDTLTDDEPVLYGADYTEATKRVATWVESSQGAPKDVVDEMDRFFKQASLLPVDPATLLHVGHPYGALDAMLLARIHIADGAGEQPSKQAKATPFIISPAYTPIVQPWLDLLSTDVGKVGTFSADTLSRPTPQSYQTSERWEVLLQQSASIHGTTWLHAYHLGVIAAERLNFAAAATLFKQSISLKPTAVGYRNLALLSSEAGEQNNRWRLYQLAWQQAVVESSSSTSEGGYDGDTDDIARRLQYSLAGEISLYLAAMSYVYDHNKANNTCDRWQELGEFLNEITTVAGCANRGLHCDNDMVAFGYVGHQFSKQTVEGCDAVLHTLSTWPFQTDDMTGYTAMGNYAVEYACDQYASVCQQPGKTNGLWGRCVLLQAMAKAGHPLTPAEEKKVLAEKPPPYWLEASEWSPVK
eukprot:m.198292 g.198292  ORF g.198292 m.198292 type:complete len:850 (+) comp32689_c0_seq1:544-3093(+)